MLKNLIIAVLSALGATVITKHFADKKIIELQREFNAKEYEIHSSSFSSGWDYGYTNGRKTMWIDTMNGNRPESWV